MKRLGQNGAACARLSGEKRGLPHAHIRLLLEQKIKPNEIDRIIVELPNKEVDPLLLDIVCRNMIHGPCGDFKNISPCMMEGVLKNIRDSSSNIF